MATKGIAILSQDRFAQVVDQILLRNGHQRWRASCPFHPYLAGYHVWLDVGRTAREIVAAWSSRHGVEKGLYEALLGRRDERLATNRDSRADWTARGRERSGRRLRKRRRRAVWSCLINNVQRTSAGRCDRSRRVTRQARDIGRILLADRRKTVFFEASIVQLRPQSSCDVGFDWGG